MITRVYEKLAKKYPGSHLHSHVETVGHHTYLITASLISADGEAIEAIEHFGSGDVGLLKDQAYMRLAKKLTKKDIAPASTAD